MSVSCVAASWWRSAFSTWQQQAGAAFFTTSLLLRLGPVVDCLPRLAASVPCCVCLAAGPGRGIISEGFQALARGAPDMNSLVGLGATASFAVSAVAALLPKLGE